MAKKRNPKGLGYYYKKNGLFCWNYTIDGDYEIGEEINPGLCWTDGGEFRVETNGDYSVIFVIENEVEGHQVDYENEQECEDLGCKDCWGEKEILINKNFIVTDFWAWDEETQFARVSLKSL